MLPLSLKGYLANDAEAHRDREHPFITFAIALPQSKYDPQSRQYIDYAPIWVSCIKNVSADKIDSTIARLKSGTYIDAQALNVIFKIVESKNKPGENIIVADAKIDRIWKTIGKNERAAASSQYASPKTQYTSKGTAYTQVQQQAAPPPSPAAPATPQAPPPEPPNDSSDLPF